VHQLDIYLATWLEHNQGVSLTERNYKNRLLSRFFIEQEGLSHADLKKYQTEGVLSIKTKSSRNKK